MVRVRVSFGIMVSRKVDTICNPPRVDYGQG